jgi:electron transport complex protein RnfG
MTIILGIQSFIANDDTMTKENGVYIINTTELGKNIEGYNGPTPLKVYINKNKVEKIEFLKSMESPKYYAKVKKALIDKWNNLKVNDAKKLQVDAVTGATYSSEAVIKNVQLALDYYQNHK